MFKMKLFITLVILILCTLGFGLTASFVQDNTLRNFDTVIISWIRQWESPALTILMKFFTTIGGGLPVLLLIITVMFVLYTVLGHRKELIFLAGVMFGSTLINWGLKLLFHRARPVIHRIIEAEGYSFPSGHSMAAFSFYGALAFLIWSHVSTSLGRSVVILLSTLFIFAIGISRIYLGVHYPTDVIGGYFISGCWLTLSIMLYPKFMSRHS
ncbi:MULTISPECIES: phosphatase PAP2 family protein [Paenibacillus]|uniref:phosphatase PAP2 family protein n=1 Tax=Paenibacillus TaxID=44249 RepID=UPI002FE30B23